MTAPALTADEMLLWHTQTSDRLRGLLEQHPEALAFPCDIAKTSTLGGLLQHIVAVELRYAERLAGEPATEYDTIPYGTVAEVYATHDRAMELYRKVLADSSVNWDEEIEFVTRSLGAMVATRKAVFFHALTHSIRHYAQITTLLRQHEITMKFPLDYLFVAARRV
jgi:uncharacterized damage-inducible protein DinB